MTTAPPPPPVPDRGDPADPWALRRPAHPPGRGLAIGIAALAVVAALVVAAVAGVVVVVSDDTTPSSEAVAPGAWDPDVEQIATFVADARGLDWAHPVPVRFLDDDEFVAEITDLGAEPTDEELESIAEAQAVLEALSLLPTGVDLREAIEDAAAVSVLAFYSWEDGEIVMRGRDLTPLSRATLAHELTHALQDQHFDLGALQEEADDAGSSGALESVVEGDALRIETDYVLSLSSTDQAEVSASELAELEGAGRALELEDVPEIVEAFLVLPYAVGPGLVESVLEARGKRAVDDLFSPELTEADVLTPARHLEGVAAIDVPAPSMPADAESVGEEEPFGAMWWYLMLAARLDAVDALTAVDGWGGDASILYEVDEVSCVAASYRGRDAEATQQMREALDRWVVAVPSGSAEVDDLGDDLVLRACAPAGTEAGPTQPLVDAVLLAAERGTIFSQLLAEGAPWGVAWCVTNELAFDRELSVLFTREELSPEEGSLVEDRAFEAGFACAERPGR